MTITFKCSDEAFLNLVHAVANYYDDGDGWEMMFGEGVEDEEILSDSNGTMQCVAALMEAMTL